MGAEEIYEALMEKNVGQLGYRDGHELLLVTFDTLDRFIGVPLPGLVQ